MTSCHEENLWFLCWSSWIDSWASIVCQTLLSRVWISPTRAGVLSSYLSSMHLFFHLRWCCVKYRPPAGRRVAGREVILMMSDIMELCSQIQVYFIILSPPRHSKSRSLPSPTSPLHWQQTYWWLPFSLDNMLANGVFTQATTLLMSPVAMSPGNHGYVTWQPWLCHLVTLVTLVMSETVCIFHLSNSPLPTLTPK